MRRESTRDFHHSLLGRHPTAFVVLLLATLVEVGLWYATYHAPRLGGLAYIPGILCGWLVILITVLVVSIGELRASMRERAGIVDGPQATGASGRGMIALWLVLTIVANALVVAIWAK